MTDSANNLTENEAGSIAKLVLRTLYSCVVLLALFAALWTALFPTAACSLYRDLGNEARAYDCAQRASRINGGEKRVNALISCISLGGGLFNENPDYARRLLADTEAFLADGACAQRTPKIDAYNLSAAPKTMHANLFSYNAYVRELRARAMAHLGDATLLQTAVTAIYTADAFEGAALIGEIAAHCYQASKDGNAVTAVAVSDIEAVAAAYFTVVDGGKEERTALQNLYLIKQYEKLVSRLALVDNAAADRLSKVSYGGEAKDITALYGELLKQYCI